MLRNALYLNNPFVNNPLFNGVAFNYPPARIPLYTLATSATDRPTRRVTANTVDYETEESTDETTTETTTVDGEEAGTDEAEEFRDGSAIK